MICARCGSPNTTTREAPALGYDDRGGVNISVQCHDCQRRSRAFRPAERKRVHAMAVDRVMLATQDALAATVTVPGVVNRVTFMIDGVECHPDDCISYHEPGEHGVYEVGEAYAATGPVAWTQDVPLERVAEAIVWLGEACPVHTLPGPRARALRDGDNKPLPPLSYTHVCPECSHVWEAGRLENECPRCAEDKALCAAVNRHHGTLMAMTTCTLCGATVGSWRYVETTPDGRDVFQANSCGHVWSSARPAEAP